MREYYKYSEWHIVEHNKVKYIFNPYFQGVGAWFILTFDNRPGTGASNQQELNQAFFGRPDIPSMYERFMEASPDEREALKTQSMGWLNLKVKALKQNEENLSFILNKYKETPAIGGMFFYTYDAKGKDELPYWDKFPLILLLEDQGNHFLGLNFHYLDYETRLKIISNIPASYDKTKNMKTANITYSQVKSSSKYKDLKQYCIKKYIKNNVVGKILPVEAHEWIFAASLPVADFVKKGTKIKNVKRDVWGKSKKSNIRR